MSDDGLDGDYADRCASVLHKQHDEYNKQDTAQQLCIKRPQDVMQAVICCLCLHLCLSLCRGCFGTQHLLGHLHLLCFIYQLCSTNACGLPQPHERLYNLRADGGRSA